MPNIQVTHDASTNNARSESALVINPNNPSQIVAASKKFNNIHTYDFTLATSYSTDGGQHWNDSAAFPLPSGATVMTDPTMAWDDAGNIYMVGLVGNNPPTWDTIGIAIYKSTDGGQTWGNPNLIHTSSFDDKQWVAGDGNPSSPFHGRIYAVWDDGSTMRFARTLDYGMSWTGTAGNTVAGTSLAGDSFSPEINVSANGDIYVVWIAGSTIKMIVSRDGGDSFQTVISPATGVTTLSASLPAPHGWPNLPGGIFRVLTIPTACVYGNTVVVAWDDFREGVSRIYYALSGNGGFSWLTGVNGQPLLLGALPSNLHHFFPQIIADPYGVIGCSFYEFGPKPVTPLIDVIMAQSFDNGGTFTHFTVTDQPWDPTVDAPWSHGDSNATFIGDYFGIDASVNGFYPLWTDTRTGVQELFTAIVPQKKLVFVIERSTLGQDEISARRANGQLPIPDAFRVIADGFTAAQLGLTNTGSHLPSLPIVAPGTGIQITATGNISEFGDYGPEVQRFTFNFNMDFPNNSAFAFAGETEMLTLTINALGISAAAQIELIKQPNPFILHGDPAWLSVDLRVFAITEGTGMFGVTGIANAADAPRFIRDMMASISPAQFDSLSTAEDGSKLYLQPNNEFNVPVYNFALAKVHYIGLIGAANVRVFFRLFQAQTTSAAFDPSTTYRRAINPAGQPIALPGIQGSDYVTIPCFADGRVNSSIDDLTHQQDNANIQTFAASGGAEEDRFFGCWLDINQPGNPVLPITVPVLANGPFTSGTNPPLSIQQSILRNLHQCLIAEIAFDPIAIPLGKDPGNWDKLAQRNLAWSDAGSAQAVSTFEIKPSSLGLARNETPDELMIDWGRLPSSCTAAIYLPAVSADEVISMASRMYTSHNFTKFDEHTLQCPTIGITYLPIPAGSPINYTGLLSVELPDNLRKGATYVIAVRQITNAYGKWWFKEGASYRKGNEQNMMVTPSTRLDWRKVSGAFQITVPVKNKKSLLLREERDLSVLRWIETSIPAGNRWYQVFQRYVQKIGERVKSFGGDPGSILPSPTGDGKGETCPPPAPGHGKEQLLSYSGKIAGLIFDHFGDFEGFILETKEGEHRFMSREKEIKQLCSRCWEERLRLTVFAERDEKHRPMRIVIHEPPVSI